MSNENAASFKAQMLRAVTPDVLIDTYLDEASNVHFTVSVGPYRGLSFKGFASIETFLKAESFNDFVYRCDFNVAMALKGRDWLSFEEVREVQTQLENIHSLLLKRKKLTKHNSAFCHSIQLTQTVELKHYLYQASDEMIHVILTLPNKGIRTIKVPVKDYIYNTNGITERIFDMAQEVKIQTTAMKKAIKDTKEEYTNKMDTAFLKGFVGVN